MNFEFTQSDFEQLAERDITARIVENQLSQISQGYPRTQVTSAVVLGGGIQQLTDEEMDRSVALFDEFKGMLAKFVPASGAATRMFKRQYEYLQGKRTDEEGNPINPFEDTIDLYPFAPALREALKARGLDLDTLQHEGNYEAILRTLLDDEGMGYGSRPKALIPFHTYAGGQVRTALEEHLYEAVSYARTATGEAHLHFTVDQRHREAFQAAFEKSAKRLEKERKTQFVLHLSEQMRSTDTIAANLDGTPYRQPDGTLLFRPAGHGALLANLQEVTADLIFIKNIDNVLPDQLKSETIRYKKALAGLLLSLRAKIYGFVESLFTQTISEEQCQEMLDFCRRELNYRLPVGFNDAPLEARLRYLRIKLNRPLRVCGVVRNEGEPGGGPYWVRERDGSESLQIVETSQMDLDDPRVQDIVGKSRYFNPVDIVCCIKDYKGEPFKLHKYMNKNTGFVAQKSVNGTPIKALELPGLWNGSMAEWNTVLVEVPSITFSPVKEMADLLRAEHLAKE